MAVIDGRTWLEYLTPQVCWELLTSTPVGRLAVIEDSAPAIYPVNHVVDGESIVFRTDRGSKLRGLLRVPLVCFEVDGTDLDESTGWSVLVKGRAEELHQPDDLHRVSQLPLEIWAVGAKHHWIRIVPEQVTGRRLWTRKTSTPPRGVPT
jgi:nitroimidazol reductase NimA-like FMN-containing flavoprotein (pyridoxamine 5'-phosphate oxidase superfamily)